MAIFILDHTSTSDYYVRETTIAPLVFSSPFDYVILLFSFFLKSTVKVFRANLKITRLINDMFTKEDDGVSMKRSLHSRYGGVC